MSIAFQDLAVQFSEDEWQLLGEGQRELYRDVMQENYEALVSLGKELAAPWGLWGGVASVHAEAQKGGWPQHQACQSRPGTGPALVFIHKRSTSEAVSREPQPGWGSRWPVNAAWILWTALQSRARFGRAGQLVRHQQGRLPGSDALVLEVRVVTQTRV